MLRRAHFYAFLLFLNQVFFLMYCISKYFTFSSPPDQITIILPETEIKYLEKSIGREKGEAGISPRLMFVLSIQWYEIISKQ